MSVNRRLNDWQLYPACVRSQISGWRDQSLSLGAGGSRGISARPWGGAGAGGVMARWRRRR